MNRIKELRLKKGIKQIELCRVFNVTQGNVSAWETGKWEPDQETLIKLADYFGVSVDYLLGRTDDPSPTPSPSEEYKLEGMYFHLAKEAQELGLQQEDIDFMLEFYRKHKQRNEEYRKKNQDKK